MQLNYNANMNHIQNRIEAANEDDQEVLSTLANEKDSLSIRKKKNIEDLAKARHDMIVRSP